MLSIKRPSLPVWKVPAVRPVRRLMNKKLLRRGGGRCEGGKWNDKWSDVLGSLYCSSGRYVIFHGNPSSEEGEAETAGAVKHVAVGDTILTSSGF